MARKGVIEIIRIAFDVSSHNLAPIVDATNLSRYNPRERHVKGGKRASIE